MTTMLYEIRMTCSGTLYKFVRLSYRPKNPSRTRQDLGASIMRFQPPDFACCQHYIRNVKHSRLELVLIFSLHVLYMLLAGDRQI